MAQTITFTYSMDGVLKSVRNKTHKIGVSYLQNDRKSSYNAQADDTPTDTKIVVDAADKAFANVVMSLSRYVSSINSGAAGWTLVLAMPDTWRTANKHGLENDIEDYIVNSATSEFLAASGQPDLSRRYAVDAASSFTAMRLKALDRKSPMA